MFFRISKKRVNIKSSLYSKYYAEACNEWRGASPRLGACWAISSEETSHWWRDVGDTVFDLTGQGIELGSYCAGGDVFNH